MKTVLMILFAATLFTGCKKDKGEDQLPPATQIGANTFGCKINGRVFVPKGYDPNRIKPNPHIIYDYGLNGQPYLYIEVNRFKDYNGQQIISFGNLNNLGYYSLSDNMSFSCLWPNVIGSCGTVAFDTTIQKWGGGYITKLDIANHIISGTFDFKYKTQSCDTVYITDGRFDIKF